MTMAELTPFGTHFAASLERSRVQNQAMWPVTLTTAQRRTLTS
jgi:hypothetical protein